MKKLLALLTTGILLTACSGTNTETATEMSSEATVSSVVEDTVSVTINVSVDGKEIEEGSKELEVEQGANLLDVMKEHYDIEEEKTFINSINGHQQDTEAKRYWVFDLNGEMAPAGANDTELQEGDVVEWKLEAM